MAGKSGSSVPSKRWNQMALVRKIHLRSAIGMPAFSLMAVSLKSIKRLPLTSVGKLFPTLELSAWVMQRKQGQALS